ncbi:MAG: hypothetical protein RL375_2197 [Pseudomonadota bacterium]
MPTTTSMTGKAPYRWPHPVDRPGRRIADGLLVTLMLVMSGLLAGCANLRPSTAVDPERLRQGVQVVRTLPAALPDKSSAVPNTQFVLLSSESAAQMLVPVPFVGEAVAGALNASAAGRLATRFASLDPYRNVQAALQGSALIRADGSAGAMTLQPYVFVQECIDDRYRLTLVGHLQGGDWVGRYLVHLPTTYSPAEVDQPTPQVLAAMEREIAEGATQLRRLLERGARGELGPSGVRAEVGSLHLVGARAAGLVSPTLVRVKDADVIEETSDHVLLRIAGDMKSPASAGGLFFGVHLMRKDQLHTFKKTGAAS